MAKLYYGHCNSNGVKIHYYRTGDIKPPVVLLHGITDNGLCWNRLALYLEPDYDVVMVDARGHGLSDAPESGYTAEDHAGDVAAVIHQLGLEKPVLVGHSMGAQSAATTAATYPELVSKIVLEDPPWRDSVNGDEQHRREWRQGLRSRVEEMRVKALDELIADGKAEHPNWDESEWFQWAKSKQQVKPQIGAVANEPQTPWRDIAGKITCPALLVTGEPQLGAIVTPQIAKEAVAFWRKKGFVVHIPAAGHNIRRENFPLFLNAVTHFIARK